MFLIDFGDCINLSFHCYFQINRLQTSKAHLNSIMMNMSQQLATLRISNSLEKSTEVMKSMQNLVKITEISATMQEMSREMMKAGIIDEMLNETLEDAMGDREEVEEEAEEEVNKLLFEITNGQLGQAPEVVSDSLPSIGVASTSKAKVQPAAKQAQTTSEGNNDNDEDIDEMRQRLEALKN